jgi:ABC-type transport system substrate-binding protein
MKRKFLTVALMITIILSPLLVKSQETEVQTIFNMILLSPNNNLERNQYSVLIQNILPLVGIGVRFHESTTWDNIAIRSWNYPFKDYDYIPTYMEGGYDAIFNDWSWDLDWDPSGIFNCEYISCQLHGKNYYQYVNPMYDSKLQQYLTEFDPIKREEYAHELQAILYADLPSICIAYPRMLYGFRESLAGIDSQLLSISKHRSENWSNSEDSIINYAIPEEISANSIFSQYNIFDNLWVSSVYSGLFQRNQFSYEWSPVIALNCSLSYDRKNYTVILDSNAKFSDGSPVLAEDVKYSYELHMTPMINSKHYNFLMNWLDSNDSIEIVDAQTLNFNLTTVSPFSKSIVSLGIVDKSSIEPAISTYGYTLFDETPLNGNVSDILVKSCGPFRLSNYSSSEVRLLPNPYWSSLNCSNGNDPYLDELIFRNIKSKDEAFSGLISGTVDVLDGNYGFGYTSSFDELSDIRGESVKAMRYHELGLNMKHPIFGTGELTPEGNSGAALNMRKAISHAIPRPIIVSEIYEGLAVGGSVPMPEGCIGFDDSLEPYAFDLDLAVEYTEDAGYTVMVTCCTPEPTSGLTLVVFLLSLIAISLNYRTKRTKS